MPCIYDMHGMHGMHGMHAWHGMPCMHAWHAMHAIIGMHVCHAMPCMLGMPCMGRGEAGLRVVIRLNGKFHVHTLIQRNDFPVRFVFVCVVWPRDEELPSFRTGNFSIDKVYFWGKVM